MIRIIPDAASKSQGSQIGKASLINYKGEGFVSDFEVFLNYCIN
jgi:hypothetical protein